jgi:hypothetical protein
LRFGAPDCVAAVAAIAFPAGSAADVEGVQTIVLLAIVLSCPLGAVLVKVSVSVAPLKAIVAFRVRSLLT